MNYKKNLIYFLSFIILNFIPLNGIFSQENINSNYKFEIEDIEYDINGIPFLKTKDFILKEFLQIEKGKIFKDREELDIFLSKLKTKLENKRFFYESDAKYEILSENSKEELYKIKIKVYTKDAWPILPIVLPRINDDSLLLSSKLIYNNFFGTFYNLSINSNIQFNSFNDKNKNIARNIPAWNFDINLSNINILGKYFNVEFFHKFDSKVQKEGDKEVLNYSYHESGISLSTHLGGFWGINFNSKVGLGGKYLFNKKTDTEGLFKDDSSMYVSLINEMYYSNILHKKYFRDGYSLSFIQKTEYSLFQNTVSNTLAWAFYGSKSFVDWIEFSFYYRGFKNFGENSFNINNIRGVKSYNVYGESAHIFNTTFAFAFWKWPSILEAQMGLFYDFGFLAPKDGSFNLNKNFHHGTGIEGRLYLDVLKSFTFYGSLGVDLKNLPKKSNMWNIFGGPYHIQIKFSLHY